MPIYEYICQDCENKFEVLRSMKDADATIDCRKCSSPKTHRVISMCYSKGDGGTSQSHSSGCGGCSGGNCSSCGH